MRVFEKGPAERYTLAARIWQKLGATKDSQIEDSADEKKKNESPDRRLRVVYVSDVDLLHPAFFYFRANPGRVIEGVTFEFQNVTFVLNILDSLANDRRFLDIRMRRREYGRLGAVEDEIDKVREDVAQIIDEAAAQYVKKTKENQKLADEAKKAYEDEREELLSQRSPNLGEVKAMQVRGVFEAVRRNEKVAVSKLQQRRILNGKLEKAYDKQEREIRKVQRDYKFWAVIAPPIFPLVLAIIVFFVRRSHETEGVASRRLKSTTAAGVTR